jgi:hypothetical protein
MPAPLQRVAAAAADAAAFLPELTSWSASMRTVLRLNFLLQKLNKSSRDGPSRSITITL